MPSVSKATLPYMIDLELCSACGGPMQLGVVLVFVFYCLFSVLLWRFNK